MVRTTRTGGPAKEAEVRRQAIVLTAGLMAVTGLGLVGGVPAGASTRTSPAAQHVKVGSRWTLGLTGDCEVQTFAAGGTWTADRFGDGDWYSGGAATIKEGWTTGQDAPALFKGTYSSAVAGYTGKFGAVGGSIKAELVKGVVGGC